MIEEPIKIIGKLTTTSIKGIVKDKLRMTANVNIERGSSYPTYSGDYNIIPKTQSQTLETKNKLMRDDLSIKEIPYYETSNPYGETIYIGNEVEINGN